MAKVMKTYTQKEKSQMRLKTWSVTTADGGIQVKAYLKSNAVERLQKIDPAITADAVTLYRGIPSSHQGSCDSFVEVAPGKFRLVSEF